MSIFTLKPARVSVMHRSEALTRNLLASGRHLKHWTAPHVAADFATKNLTPTGRRVNRG